MNHGDAAFETGELDVLVPDKCEGCGVQCELIQIAVALQRQKLVIENAGLSLTGKTGERFDKGIDKLVSIISEQSDMPEEIADELKEDLKQGTRQDYGHEIERLDAEIKEIQGEIDAFALACGGVLQVVGTRDGKRYTVNLCTSARAYVLNTEDDNHIPAHVRVETI